MKEIIKEAKVKLNLMFVLYFIYILVLFIFCSYIGIVPTIIAFLLSSIVVFKLIIDFINFKSIEKNNCFFDNEFYKVNSNLFFTNIGIVSFNRPFFIKYEDIALVYKHFGSDRIWSSGITEKLVIVSVSKRKYIINFLTPILFFLRTNDNQIKKIVKKIKKYNSNVRINI